MVYRRSPPTNDTYTLVPGSIRTLDLNHTVANTFRCREETVPRFEIQENDVVGACVKNMGNVDPLYLVGDTDDDSANNKLYQLDRGMTEKCQNDRLESVDTGHDDFMQRDEFVLHLYAIIGESYYHFS